MTNWEKVKEEVLIKCKRYCCKCGRYMGIGIEVHHIIQRAKGGKDEFDNAIPLCFDCHCEIGSYNDDHPKGNKFKSNELKRIRDEFYSIVPSLPRYEIYSESDKDLLDRFKIDFTDYIEYCIDKDFAAEPVNSCLADELDDLIKRWGKRKNTFESNHIENIKIEILKTLKGLCSYITPVYFHMIDDGRIIFNSSSIEDGIRLEELRRESLKYRTELHRLLETLYSL